MSKSNLDQLQPDAFAQSNQHEPGSTPETDRDARPYPSPEHAQHINFEGCDSVVMSPEEYEALYEQARKTERERNAALAERDAAIKAQPINTHVRLFDLVRYMRSELLNAGLITEDEYAWLAHTSPMAASPKGGSPSRERLEDYDALRARLKSAEDAMQESLEILTDNPEPDGEIIEAVRKLRAALAQPAEGGAR